MRPEIEKLIEMVRSSDIKIQQEGLYELSVVLEINTFGKWEGYRLQQLIPWNLRLIVLNEKEQEEIAEQLSQIYINHNKNWINSENPKLITSILWVLGKIEGKAALVPLINIFKQCRTTFTEKDFSAFFRSWGDCFWEIDAETKLLLETTNFIYFLEIECTSKDPNLSQWSKKYLECLREVRAIE